MKSVDLSSGVIRRDELYRKQELLRRLGFREAGFQSLRRAGLPIIRLGGQVFISGRLAIEWFEAQAMQQAAAAAGGSDV